MNEDIQTGDWLFLVFGCLLAIIFSAILTYVTDDLSIFLMSLLMFLMIIALVVIFHNEFTNK